MVKDLFLESRNIQTQNVPLSSSQFGLVILVAKNISLHAFFWFFVNSVVQAYSFRSRIKETKLQEQKFCVMWKTRILKNKHLDKLEVCQNEAVNKLLNLEKKTCFIDVHNWLLYLCVKFHMYCTCQLAKLEFK